MTATAIIKFKDGSTKELLLGEKLSVIDVPSHMRQSISLNQPNSGFHLSYTKPLMEEKSWESITISKQE